MSAARRSWRRRRATAAITLVMAFLTAPPAVVGANGQDTVAVKAAFVINFAKFTEWPLMVTGIPIVLCVAGDDPLASAMLQIVDGHALNGHPLTISRSQDSREWRACHVLFIGESAIRRSAVALSAITMLPVLTVSDAKGFAEGGGIIELYVDGGRMRFLINGAAAERARLRLSSRLLALATVSGGNNQ